MPSKPSQYVLFGFNEEDPEWTGYLGKDMKSIVDYIKDARVFTRSLRKSKKNGTPEGWLELINEDKNLNLGFKFHLVKVNV